MPGRRERRFKFVFAEQRQYGVGNCGLDNFDSMAMNDVHPVTITLNDRTQTFSASFQTDEQFQNGWQSVLKTAYGRADLRCGCKGKGSKRLAVKYYEGSDLFSLARFSLTGGQHAADCQYYSANPAQSGGGGDKFGVIDQQPDGSVKIRLEIGMLERGDAAGPAGPTGAPTDSVPSVKQSSMKLLGLLYYLWEEAGLN